MTVQQLLTKRLGALPVIPELVKPGGTWQTHD
jgi:hypothetical protein